MDGGQIEPNRDTGDFYLFPSIYSYSHNIWWIFIGQTSDAQHSTIGNCEFYFSHFVKLVNQLFNFITRVENTLTVDIHITQQ